jgi:hypothetical protein
MALALGSVPEDLVLILVDLEIRLPHGRLASMQVFQHGHIIMGVRLHGTGFDLMTGVVLFVLLFDWRTIGKGEGERCLATVQAILSDGGPIREIAVKEAHRKPRADGEPEIEGSRP